MYEFTDITMSFFYSMAKRENAMTLKENIANIKIPEYSEKQECFNAISHALGLLVAFGIMVFGLVKQATNSISLFYFFGLLIFGWSAFMVYLISALYHGVDKNTYQKKVLRVLDHCTIYLLIAGTYTPICFVLMSTNIIGLIMLISEWVSAVIGIILNAFLFDNKVSRVISFILYVAMGWLCLFCGGFLYIPLISFAFILGGGIAYTIGSILYAIGKKNTNLHCIFHIFVLISTIIQAIGVFLLF